MKLTTKWIGWGLACLGTATIASIVRFEAAPEYVAAGYSAIILALLEREGEPAMAVSRAGVSARYVR